MTAPKTEAEAAKREAPRGDAPKIGMVSLGCPKALVDSERILSRLRADGYAFSPDYQGAETVIVNTCGFLDSAKAESLEAIGEAISENGRVIVTGCMGKDADAIRAVHPAVLAVTGPQAYEDVVKAVHQAAPIAHDPFTDLTPAPRVEDDAGIRLTPRHYAYLKISEGCNHSCSFCIIPSLRGRLASRPPAAILREAEKLAEAGVKELLVISQDTSAYGVDLRHAESTLGGRTLRAHIQDLSRELADLGMWVRLHYVYPYPHVDKLIELMSEPAPGAGGLLPYLDIPFQHSSPTVLAAMRRPGNQVKTLERIRRWREIQPNIALRSTFIVGFPGETDADFEHLLSWLDEAQLDRVGCFQYEDVDGAASNTLDGQVPQEVKQERWERFMAKSSEISAAKLAAKVGRTMSVIIDSVDEDGAMGRSIADAPEIDGQVFLDEDFETLSPGDIISVAIDEANEYDLWGARVSP